MPRFKSREEYEKWKAERMGTSEEKPLEPPKKRPSPLEKPLEFQESFAAPEKKVQSLHEKSLQFEEKSPAARKKSLEPQEMFLEPQEIFEKSKERPWDSQKSFLDSREELLEPENKGLELDTGEEPGEVPLPRSGGRSRRRTANLRSTGELLRDSWDIFKTRFLVLVGLYLLPIFLMLGVMGIFVGVSLLSRSFLALDIKVAIAGGVLIGMIPALIVMSWGMAGFTYAVVDETVGFTEALSRGWSRLWAFTWVWSLVGFIVTGSFFLLIVPGILLGIWFVFAPFVLASEDERGMNALLKSKEYVKGQWFQVCGRITAISLMSFGVGLIPVVGSLIGIVFAPFFLLFVKLIFDDLRAMKGDSIPYPNSGGEKFKWLGLGTVGYLVLPVIMIALMGASLTLPLLMLKGMVSGQGPFNLSPPKESRPFKPTPVTQPGQGQGVRQESDQVDPQSQAGIASASRANPPEATGEAAVVRNGVRETFVLMIPRWDPSFFSRSRVFVLRPAARLKHFLHPDDVEESSFLTADGFELSALNKAMFPVEADASLIQGRDACQNGGDPFLPCLIKKAFQQSGPDALSAVIGMDEVRYFGGVRKRGEWVVGMDHPKADGLSFPDFHNQRRVADDDLKKEIVEFVRDTLLRVGGECFLNIVVEGIDHRFTVFL